MKSIHFLIGWNWRIFCRLYLIVLAITAAAELGLLILTATQVGKFGANFDALFLDSFSLGVFVIAFIAVLAVTLRPIFQANGRAKGGYSLLTLPLPRWQLLAGYVVATAIALLGLLAWQVLLCAIFYAPVMKISAMAGAAVAAPVPNIWPGGFYRAWQRNYLLRLILPGNFCDMGVLALIVLAPSVLVPCAFVHSGWRRFVAVCVGLLGVGCCAVTLTIPLSGLPVSRLYGHNPWAFNRWAWLLLLVLMAASWFWAVRALHRAELT